ncbi:MAG: hypothetical protein V1826_01530 [bacterium]
MVNHQEIGEVLYTWQAKEFATTKRPLGWYAIAGLILIGVLAYAIYTRQWMTGAVVLMLAVLIYLSQRMVPRIFDHQLTSLGVVVGERFYSYTNFKSFWVVLDSNAPVANLLPNRRVGLLLTLQLGGADIEKVRSILAEHVAEDAGRGEDVIDKIGKALKL